MPSALDVDKQGDVGDWRMALVARVAEDAPPHKKGDVVRQVSAVESVPGVLLSFVTPSSVALALNIAQRAATNAVGLRLAIAHCELQAGDSKAFGVTSETIPTLYDFLEQSMVSAVFSYQAIEAFANQVIARELNQSLEVNCRGKKQLLTPEQLERQLATGEKLAQVLPIVRSVKSPKGTALWERFNELELARDSTIHLKVKDQYAKSKESLFFQMLTATTTDFPGIAADVVSHYFKPGTEPRWLLRFLMARNNQHTEYLTDHLNFPAGRAMAIETLNQDIEGLIGAVQVLASDVQAASKLSATSDTQFARRAYVRAAFALIEGNINLMADVILRASERHEVCLLPKEIEVLRQERRIANEGGFSMVRIKFVPIRERTAPVFEMFARIFGKSFRLDKSCTGWVDFTTAIEIRNRITHPKNAASFEIEDSALQIVERARQWFADSVEVLMLEFD